MKAWIIRKHGGLDGLELVDQPEPKPGPGQVLVRVNAVSLNYRDLITVQLERPGNLPPPFVPCSDGAGEIVALGEGVSEWKTGDRVAGIFFQEWIDGRFDLAYHEAALGGSAPGMLADFVVLQAHGLVRVPDSLSDEEAAALPCAAVTAWQSLFTRGNLQSGSTVLTLGTGGVSIFALQLSVAAGAKVIVTSSSDEKLARALAMGASAGVNYRDKPDWDKEVWSLTAKRGVDHVIELGGPGTLEKSMNAVSAGGQIALIGVLTGFGPPTAPLFPLMARNARIDGIYVGSRADFEALNAFLVQHRIRPVVDRVFSMPEGRAAFAHMESGAHFGKVVIRLS
jgi:NADPH:quinone reductase-like Zn-dependent oxidoreductase